MLDAHDPPLDVALVVERFVFGTGGVENVAWQIAWELARQGEHVTVLARELDPSLSSAATRTWDRAQPCAGQPTDPPAPRAASAAPAIPFRLERLPVSRGWQPLRVRAFSRAATRATRDDRFDVVHSFARTYSQDLYRAGGGLHADYLRRMHAGAGHALRLLSPRHRILIEHERRVCRDPSQRIQCASKLVARAFVETGGIDPGRIWLQPNAVDGTRFAAPERVARGARLRRELDPEAERIWLLAGSGWRRKGLATALEAVAKLGDAGSALWVAGRDDPTPWQARIAALGLTGRVRFLGERDDLPDLYQAVDGLVLPTRYDPFANVTLEAAAAGRPIVTTAANGAAEWLGDDVTVIDPPDDADALASELEAMRSAEVRRRRGRRLRARARRFDWPRHVAALRAEYRRIERAKRDERHPTRKRT